MSSKSLLVCTFVFVILFAYAIDARADNFTITSGTATVTGSPMFGKFIIGASGLNFSVGGGTNFVVGSSMPKCFPCHAGDTVDFTASFSLRGSDWVFGFISSGGASMNLQDASSGFTFGGPTVVIPTSSDPTLTLVGQGGMSGGASGSFSVSFHGTALVTMVLIRESEGVYNLQSVNYNFNTPEPMSIILLLTGVGTLALKLRWRR